MEANATDAKAADIYILDEIGYWGVSAKDFASDLLALGSVETIHLHLNSPGGEVFDGIFIYEQLKAHAATVKVYISGIAASMAGIIALSGDEVTMSENSFYMVHRPTLGWGWNVDDLAGISEDFRKHSDMLAQVEQKLISIYVKETGMSKDDVTALVMETTWLDAAAAKEKGFITNIGEPVKAAANFKALERLGVGIPADVRAKLGADCPDCRKKGKGKAAPATPAKAGILAQIRALLGLDSAPRAGTQLSAKLNETIDSMVTDEKTRDDIIADMVTASGQTAEEVNKDIDGTNECPALTTLSSYATVLTATVAELQAAAEADGCEYAEEEQAEAVALLREMHDQLISANTQLAFEQRRASELTRQLAALGHAPAASPTKTTAADIGGKSAVAAANPEAAFLRKHQEIQNRKNQKTK